MDMGELLAKFIEKLEGKENAKFVPVRHLKPEDIERRLVLKSEKDSIRGESNLLIMRVESLLAREKLLAAEFWEHCYKTYGLDRNQKYQVSDKNVIEMRQADGDKKDGVTICFCGECK